MAAQLRILFTQSNRICYITCTYGISLWRDKGICTEDILPRRHRRILQENWVFVCSNLIVCFITCTFDTIVTWQRCWYRGYPYTVMLQLILQLGMWSLILIRGVGSHFILKIESRHYHLPLLTRVDRIIESHHRIRLVN